MLSIVFNKLNTYFTKNSFFRTKKHILQLDPVSVTQKNSRSTLMIKRHCSDKPPFYVFFLQQLQQCNRISCCTHFNAVKPCGNKSQFEGLKIRFLQELSRFLSGFLKLFLSLSSLILSQRDTQWMHGLGRTSEFCLAKTIFAGMDMQFKLNFCKT